MLSNNLILLSQNMQYNLIQKSSTSDPIKKTLKYKFGARLQQSHANLFNFTKDNLTYLK